MSKLSPVKSFSDMKGFDLILQSILSLESFHRIVLSDGYDQNSPINFVSNLRGKYLLVHGFRKYIGSSAIYATKNPKIFKKR